jgi:plastocyanin domain-containing protein
MTSGLVGCQEKPIETVDYATVQPYQHRQVIIIKAENHVFSPSVGILQAGLPAEVHFFRSREGNSPCGGQVKLPALSRTLTFKDDETSVSLKWLPQKEDTIAYSCGMDMMHGTLKVLSPKAFEAALK